MLKIKRSIRSATIILLITIMLGAATLAGCGSNNSPTGTTTQATQVYMTIGTERISAAEFSLNYRVFLSQYYIDPTTDEGKAYLAEACTVDDNFATFEDYFKDQAAKQIQQYVILAANAKAAALTLDEAEKTEMQGVLDELATSAASTGQTIEEYLAENFGEGVDTAIVQRYLEKNFIADKYAFQMIEQYSFSDQEVQTYYNQNKADFDLVDFRSFTITAEVAAGEQVASATALAAAKTTADEMMAKITDQESFKAQCIVYAAAEDKATYTTTDQSLTIDAAKAELYDAAMGEWLFSADRTTGNMTVIESTTDMTVVYFIGRQINNMPGPVSVRHLLILVDKNTATTAEITAAQTKAESLLTQFKAGAATEDAFAKLVNENSEDPGSNTTGGLYTDITPESGYVDEFLNWAIDATRVPGDTGIIQTDYGFHIMYFVSQGGFAWQTAAKDELIRNKFIEYIEEQAAEFPIVIL